jgi:hypothetical protein
MYHPLRWAIRDIRSFLRLDLTKREQYLVSPARNFTRKRCLTFDRTAVLVLGLLKKAWL